MTDVMILACRPKDLQAWTQAWGLPPIDESVLPAYTDSIEADCEKCGWTLLVGPRVAALKRDNPQASLVCFVCAADLSKGAEVSVHHLGNVNYRKDRS